MSDIRRFKAVEDFSQGEDSRYVILYDGEGNIVTEGDWYHDKIDEVIDGFFLAFDYLGETVDVEWVEVNKDWDNEEEDEE
jgi:hypothetical protein